MKKLILSAVAVAVIAAPTQVSAQIAPASSAPSAPVAYNASASAAAQQQSGTAVQYNGPPIIHIPGDKQGMYPRFISTRNPGELQRFVDENGVQGVQDAVDGSLLECGDIFDLNVQLADYDRGIANYGAEGNKLMRDLPRHVAWQQILTVGQTLAGVGVGLATGGVPGLAYGGQNIIGGIKQLGNDKWAGRLDKHFLHGSQLTVQGMRVFLASQRIYQREMVKYCPILEDYVAKYGKTVRFTTVAAPAPTNR